MMDFSKNPVILFAMFRQASMSNPAGADMAPCRSVAILFHGEAGIFLQESPPSALPDLDKTWDAQNYVLRELKLGRLPNYHNTIRYTNIFTRPILHTSNKYGTVDKF